ncbi:alpha/beta hydrolase [Halopseudomonas pachastrellae]|nr:alpha/beta hydrolase [Halopseudomonas pachastrellae]
MAITIHMGLYRHLIQWGAGAAYAVLAFDLPGHGLSSGERASIDCFLRYQKVLDGVCWSKPCSGSCRRPAHAGAEHRWRDFD